MKVNLNNAKFVKSVTDISDLPGLPLPKIVFSGRSNVGKSSVINRILNRKNFARVGDTPGKTVHINFFLIDEKLYFVDLPGYGYAKVSMREKERWAKLIEAYFKDFSNVTFGVCIGDIRHKPTGDDALMVNWFKSTGVRFIVLANKLDKIKKNELEGKIHVICQTLEVPREAVIPFSAKNGTGAGKVVSEIQGIGEG